MGNFCTFSCDRVATEASSFGQCGFVDSTVTSLTLSAAVSETHVPNSIIITSVARVRWNFDAFITLSTFTYRRDRRRFDYLDPFCLHLRLEKQMILFQIQLFLFEPIDRIRSPLSFALGPLLIQ